MQITNTSFASLVMIMFPLLGDRILAEPTVLFPRPLWERGRERGIEILHFAQDDKIRPAIPKL